MAGSTGLLMVHPVAALVVFVIGGRLVMTTDWDDL